MVTGTGTTAAKGDWWLRMSTERRAREKALFQKLVTHFYLVSGPPVQARLCHACLPEGWDYNRDWQ